MPDPDPESPQQHASPKAGRGGNIPPVEHRWKPGVSPNPAGRPKGSDVRAIIQRQWAKNPNGDGEGQLAFAHAERIVKAVIDRDTTALEVELKLLHEVCGKPKEHIELDAHVSGEIRIVGWEDDE